MFRVEFTDGAEKDLAGLDKTIAERVLNHIVRLAEHVEVLVHQRLKGRQWGNAFRLRVGAYRVIYLMNRQSETIVILKVGHRRDIYEA